MREAPWAEGGPGRTIRRTAAPPTHQGPPCPAKGWCRVQGPHALAKQGILHGDPPCKQGPGRRVFKGTPAPTGVRPEERLGPEHTPRGTGRTTPGSLLPNGRAHASTQNARQVVQESSGFRRPGYPHDLRIARLASTDRERPAGKQPRVSEFHDPQFFGHNNASDWPLVGKGGTRVGAVGFRGAPCAPNRASPTRASRGSAKTAAATEATTSSSTTCNHGTQTGAYTWRVQ